MNDAEKGAPTSAENQGPAIAMPVTVVSSKNDTNTSVRVELSWVDLVDQFTAGPKERAAKDGEAIVLAEFASGGKRCDEDVTALTGWGIDLDQPFTAAQIRERLNGYCYVAHTTFSSSPGAERWRIILPLAQPVPPTKCRALFAYFSEKFDKKADVQCKNASRVWYLPACPPGAGEHFQSIVQPGTPFDATTLADDDQHQDEARDQKFDPRDPREMERLREALSFLDADDRGTWLKVCFALGHAFEHEDGAGYRLLTDWAAQSAKYEEGETERLFQQRAEGDSIVTLGTVFHMAAEAGWVPLAPDADHSRIADALLRKLEQHYGVRPVFTLGQFWVVEDGLWVPLESDRVAAMAGKWFGGFKFCHRGADFRSVTWLAAQEVADDRYFEEGAVGIACPRDLWRVDAAGEIRSEPLRPEHRMRIRVAAEPDFESKAPRFEALLAQALNEEQQALLQCLFGAAITRQLWRYRVAAMLLGGTTTSKTTLLTILKSVLPPDQVGATSPQRWDNEYYVAALSGKVLNIVGELDPHQPIPGGAFKSVVGNDLIDGRHPTHRPFSFVCQAAHFFNCNRLPPTTDRSDAFFIRWRILHFKHRVAEKDIVADLAEQIVKEEIGPVLAWMLRGAQRIARERALPVTDEHKVMITKWRDANNSALQFVCDPEQCELVADGRETDGQELFQRYQQWAGSVGVKAFGRNGFYDALEEGAGRLGIVRRDEHKRTIFRGVVTCF